MKIKTKGMLFSIILIFFTTTVLGVFAYFHFKNILVNEVDKAVVRVAKESSEHLSSYINQYVAPLKGLSENEDIKSMDWNKQKKLISEQIYPQYQNVAVVDTKGVAHYNDDSVLDLSDRKYIMEALKGKVSFSDVIISRKTGKNVIMIGVPIYQGNGIKGALIARLNADFLSDYASTRGYGKNGRAYIISNEGTFISKPKQENSGKYYNLYKIAKTDRNYTSFSGFIRKSTEKKFGFGKYSFAGKNIIMGYAYVKETHWRIYIGTFEEEILAGLSGLKHMMFLLALLTLAGCTIGACFFVDSFTKPIVELDHLFSQGARGDLTIRFTKKSKDEIGRMGLSFNRMMDEIKTLTQYDPLTLLLNQYVLEKDVDHLIHSGTKAEFSLIMVSIDKFGLINETYGYSYGDSILVEIAKRISDSVFANYQVYRYKGDQFVVLCNGTMKEADMTADKMLTELVKSYQINGKTINVNISIGIFNYNEDSKQEEPLKAVTQAKNYAKYLGSNQIQTYDEKLYQNMTLMKELQADILTAITENQFFLVYQPLFYLNNEYIAEVEALIRWRHPEKGLLYPDRFIDLAETSGFIIDIDRWVLETACKQLQSWKQSRKPQVLLSINISAQTFETKNFIPDVVNIINRYDIDPHLLQMEITERMVINNVDESIVKLNELRKMGIHVAIDDFGIGYSSLSYIVRLPIDSIKIDKSFVQDITSSKEAKAIVSTIINLCKTLKLNVIAEGIESKIELEYLKSNQCDIGQGYYFSKPVSVVEIEEKHMKCIMN